jgi:hypothetical protein
MLHVVKAKHLVGHRIQLWFNDGTSGEVDLSTVLDGPVFERLKDIDYFSGFELIGHTLAWPNGADFAPEYLHELLPAASAV